MASVRGQWAVITGASSGIGEATAEALAEEGMKLFVGARRLDRLDALAARLAAKTEVLTCRLDVADAASCFEFVARAEAAGPVSVLVNSAGLARGADRMLDAKEVDWREMLEANVMGLARITRAFLPGLIERKGGTIVHLGSVAGHEPYPGGTMYCASKAAVEVLAKALRYELMGTGIRVTTIEPALVETEFSEVRFSGDKEKARKPYLGLQPLTGADVADVIRFVVTRPAHVVLEEVSLYPVDQVSPMAIHRRA